MAIKSAPFYWLECDRCGMRCPDADHEVSAWSEEWMTIDCAVTSDWRVTDDEHVCPNCQAAEVMRDA